MPKQTILIKETHVAPDINDSPVRMTALGDTTKLSNLQATMGDNMHQVSAVFDTIRSSKNFLLESHHVMKPMKQYEIKNNEKASMMVEGTIRDSGQFIVKEAPLHEEMTRLHTPGDNETRNGGTMHRNNSAFDSFKDGSI